jgi:LAO/AO transport system kinase
LPVTANQQEPVSKQMERILQGDMRTVARVISQIEHRRSPVLSTLLRQVYGHAGRSLVVGITGSPGSGKSTLVAEIARTLRNSGRKVGIIAVDPTSPFSGGAILGDRIRMQALSADPGVFIRSMATRGQLGGLAAGVEDALAVLDAAGYQILLLETVGVGQDEVDIVSIAGITVLVLVPGMGDGIQAIKAGVMEIADVFVLNKADHPQAQQAERQLRAFLELLSREDGWEPPLVKTVATSGAGVSELTDIILRFGDPTKPPAKVSSRRKQLRRQRLLTVVRERLTSRVLKSVDQSTLDEFADALAARDIDPDTLVEKLLNRVLKEY